MFWATILYEYHDMSLPFDRAAATPPPAPPPACARPCRDSGPPADSASLCRPAWVLWEPASCGGQHSLRGKHGLVHIIVHNFYTWAAAATPIAARRSMLAPVKYSLKLKLFLKARYLPDGLLGHWARVHDAEEGEGHHRDQGGDLERESLGGPQHRHQEDHAASPELLASRKEVLS